MVNKNFGVSFNLHPSMITPEADAKPGHGKKMAEAFQEAAWSTDGYQGSLDTSKTGLEQIAGNQRATQRERLVAQVGLQQAEIAGKTNSVRALRGDDLGSKSALLSTTLSMLAAGAATTGPIGAVLAEIGSRQMDSIRMQSCGYTSISDVHDANVAGRAMLQAIAVHGGDDQAKEIAAATLDQLGKGYKQAPKSDKLFQREAQVHQDTQILYGAFNQIKTVTCQGDPQNPKSMAFLQGELPGGSSLTAPRPGGYAEYPRGDGFSIERKRESGWDR